MNVHPLEESDIESLKSISDKTPIAALLKVAGRAIPPGESPSEDELTTLASGDRLELHFQLQTMGVRIGDATASKTGPDGESPVRWELRFEAAMMDRFASAFRHRDWKHGLIGCAMRGIWKTEGSVAADGSAQDLSAYFKPREIVALRWDASREKEKDRAKEIPLVNLSDAGGGGTPGPGSRTNVKAKKR